MSAHKHAALIAEWIKDTSRVVEFRFGKNDHWKKTTTPAWDEPTEYRFADTVKPEVTSPLSDDEIDAIWWSIKPVGNEMPSHHDIGRAIAIAAKIATIREVAAMPIDEKLVTYTSCNDRAAECIRDYDAEHKRTLLSGIGE